TTIRYSPNHGQSRRPFLSPSCLRGSLAQASRWNTSCKHELRIVKLASGWCPERRKRRKAEIPRQIVADRLLAKVVREVTVDLHAACPPTSLPTSPRPCPAWRSDIFRIFPGSM